MNNWVKSTLGVSLGGIFVLIATNGDAFFKSISAGWLFLLQLTEEAPLGLSSFLLAFALAVATQPFLRRYLPQMEDDIARAFLIDSAAIVIGVAVMWLQMRTLDALLLGMLAGFTAPWAYRGICAAITLAVTTAAARPKQERAP